MHDPTKELRVSLRVPTTESDFFLFDVKSRLDAIARRSGHEIAWSKLDLKTDLLAPLGPELSAVLGDEAGRHRAQYVPANSQTGRILTAYVEGELPGVPAIINVVRTYNYPSRRWTNHHSQEDHSLDAALAGTV